MQDFSVRGEGSTGFARLWPKTEHAKRERNITQEQKRKKKTQYENASFRSVRKKAFFRTANGRALCYSAALRPRVTSWNSRILAEPSKAWYTYTRHQALWALGTTGVTLHRKQ